MVIDNGGFEHILVGRMVDTGQPFLGRRQEMDEHLGSRTSIR